MARYKLKVEVHCTRPNWVFEERNKQYQNGTYRLYLNNELLVERKWIWDDQSFIDEEITVNIDPGTICNLKLESVIKNVAQAKFNLKNLRRNTYPCGQQQNDLEISFII